MTISNAHLIPCFTFCIPLSHLSHSCVPVVAKKKSIIQREMMLFFPLFTFEKGRFGMFFFGCFAISFFNCNPNIAALAVTSRYFALFCPFLPVNK